MVNDHTDAREETRCRTCIYYSFRSAARVILYSFINTYVYAYIHAYIHTYIYIDANIQE